MRKMITVVMTTLALSSALTACNDSDTGVTSGPTEQGANAASEDSSGTASSTLSPASTRPSDRVVVIASKEYTCATLISDHSACDARWQKAFNTWGARIDNYVVKAPLGPLPKEARMKYEDVATAGLSACLTAQQGADGQWPEQPFVDFMSKAFPEEKTTLFLPFWFGAKSHLCPDAFAKHVQRLAP